MEKIQVQFLKEGSERAWISKIRINEIKTSSVDTSRTDIDFAKYPKGGGELEGEEANREREVAEGEVGEEERKGE